MDSPGKTLENAPNLLKGRGYDLPVFHAPTSNRRNVSALVPEETARRPSAHFRQFPFAVGSQIVHAAGVAAQQRVFGQTVRLGGLIRQENAIEVGPHRVHDPAVGSGLHRQVDEHRVDEFPAGYSE